MNLDFSNLLTVEEVADQLRVHPETVRRWLREERLEGYRISRRAGWRIRPESVTKMIEGQIEELNEKKPAA